MLKILSIGNSFSQDSHRYLYSIAKADEREILTYNMYIGGCSLEQHWSNYSTNGLYSFQKNGVSDNCVEISISDALKFEKWDVITLQQASHFSGKIETYSPYIEKLISAIKSACPQARLFLHETWEYEYNSEHPRFVDYNSDCGQMFRQLKYAYHNVAESNNLPLIPTGEVVNLVKKLPEFDSENGGQSLYRDGFHMHLNYGRYLAAAVWYETVCDGNILGNAFLPSDDGVADIEKIKIIQKQVHSFITASEKAKQLS